MALNPIEFTKDTHIPVLSGDDVRRIREALNWTQKGLARILGLGSGGQKTVSAWETGQRVPGPVTVALLAIADGFRISQSVAAHALHYDPQGDLKSYFPRDGRPHSITPATNEEVRVTARRERRIRELAQQILDITDHNEERE